MARPSSQSPVKLRAVVLGSGNIGADLMVKLSRSEILECVALVGRNLSSPGLTKAATMGIAISTDGIDFIIKNPDLCDVVFDATSAVSHLEHAPILKKMGKFVVDLTPAKVGPFVVPAIDAAGPLEMNCNMVTCGGQASVPVAWALGQAHDDIEYVEVISSIASRSAGPATRRNLDEYIHTTESAVKAYSRARFAKAILNLNPAVPCINMQTTIFAKVAKPNLEKFGEVLQGVVRQVRQYVPGYEILMGPKIDNDRIAVMLRVVGLGDYLPAYAGNLDIINCAAIASAERYAHQVLKVTPSLRIVQ
jgi:acetaldehyde dehydrogenase (acetylating)